MHTLEDNLLNAVIRRNQLAALVARNAKNPKGDKALHRLAIKSLAKAVEDLTQAALALAEAKKQAR